MSSKAIIVAAGRGRRLGDHTAEIPKCMVPVAGRPILHRQLSALTAAGVDDVVIVRGYLGDRISPGRPARFVDNPSWQTNNILASLLHAAHEMDGGFFFSYSDIVFAPAVAQALAAARAEATADVAAALIVDRRWADAYEGRTLHPVSEAELAAVRPSATARDAAITRVGKRAVPQAQAAGEFIGLAYFTAAGATALRALWAELVEGGLEQPFGDAAQLRNAYLTDALNALIARGHRLLPVFIDGAWREIDTDQDLANAEAVVDTWA
jgi:choline kinase